MEIRQLRTFIALVESQFNMSRAAEKLNLVQSALSQQLNRLENELGAKLFIRKGKRLKSLTTVGEEVFKQATIVLSAINNIHSVGKEYTERDFGVLNIGTTHMQARYILPPVIKLFSQLYPDVELQIHQGTPQQLVQLAMNYEVDFSICTEALAGNSQFTLIPCYQWNRSLIVPPEHPLADKKNISLEDLCDYPIVTYVAGFTGSKHVLETFKHSKLQPHVVLSAADSDIIKSYVREQMGIGIIASLAYDKKNDSDLKCLDLGKLFPWEITRIAYPKDKYLRKYQQVFIQLLLKQVSKHGSESGYFCLPEE